MNILKKIKKIRYQQKFKNHYYLLSTEEKEVIQLLLIAPRTSCQLRNRGFSNPDSIIDRLRRKGWSISTVFHSYNDEREFIFEGENPWN